VEVFGGESVGIILVKAMSEASLTIEILSYLLLAPRVIPTKNKTPTILEIFHKKISEGVTVSILLNDKFPSGWIKRREEEERQRLRGIGAIVKTYPRKTILHSKMLIIDRKIAYIGSVNLTTESMTRNHEILIKITDQPTIKRLSEIFFTAWKNS
jgi:phosphatidylserine/phosphatidylglycerophosphate/cardiolipin synthase-like enzyme